MGAFFMPTMGDKLNTAIIRAAIKGAREFRSGLGMTYGDSRDEAYDFGRELAHRLTFRRWDLCR